MARPHDLLLKADSIAWVSQAGKEFLSDPTKFEDLYQDAGGSDFHWLYLMWCKATSEELSVRITSKHLDDYINEQLGEA